MENLPSLKTIQATAENWEYTLLGFEMPVPDVALMIAILLAAYAMILGVRSNADRARAEIEVLYQEELLLANRRMHQADAEKRKVQTELERERQKRRRENGRSDAARRRMISARVVKNNTATPTPLVLNNQL